VARIAAYEAGTAALGVVHSPAGATGANTDAGLLYATSAVTETTWTVSYYSNSSRTTKVAEGSAAAEAVCTIAAVGGSGLSDSVTLPAVPTAGNWTVRVPIGDERLVLPRVTGAVVWGVATEDIASGEAGEVRRKGDATVLVTNATRIVAGDMLCGNATTGRCGPCSDEPPTFRIGDAINTESAGTDVLVEVLLNL
jgi:hypothetical protein